VVDWGGGVCCSCSIALPHHWLLPINCHFLRLYSAAGRSVAAVSSTIEESDLYLSLSFISVVGCGQSGRESRPSDVFMIQMV